MAKINLKSLKIEVKKEIEKTKNLKDLDEIFKKFLGRQGKLSRVLSSLEKMPKKKRIKIGKKANELKEFLEKTFEKKAKMIKEKIEKEIERREWIDITVPGKKITIGHLHPLTQIKREVEEIFQSMGFSIVEGPEVENERYNFDTLNIPPEHPARDFWDTLYLKGGNLLRTHTSPVQIRFLEKNQPPLRIIVPGRVFRHEATDASHEINFYQVEGLMVDKKGKVSAANFKAIIEEFFNRFFSGSAEASREGGGKKVEIRLRPSYFPFTEPSFEVDVSCPICNGRGCSACKNSGWVETIGAGMVHPNVFKNSGLNPKEWQGFAFGMGMDRLAMMKYRINDIRLFYSGDLRVLNQF